MSELCIRLFRLVALMQPPLVLSTKENHFPPCYWTHGSKDSKRWLDYSTKHANLASTFEHTAYNWDEYPRNPGGTEQQVRALQKAWVRAVYCDIMAWSSQIE